MELSAQYERPIARNLALSLYLAPVGEPALGPVAFPHRPSAWNDPFAPLAHHWQDATHITFGVLTAGIFSRTVKLEASLFNGREPDEDRYDFDYDGRSLDSWSARVSFNPVASWSLSASYGYLHSPEGLEPDESQQRISASVLHSTPVGNNGHGSWSLVYGANKHSNRDHLENSLVSEVNLELGANAFFARAGYARKSAIDLQVPGPADAEFDVGQFTLGYLRELGSAAGLSAGVGGLVNLARIPYPLDIEYGTMWPYGFAVYLRLRPKGMAMDHSGM
jgi:hypothetical protein